MANFTKNYETTGGTVDGGGAKSYDFTKLEGWTGGINPNGMYTKGYLNETSTPVVCKDGTKKMQPSSPNARVLDACRDNGGRAENQPVVKQLQSKEEVAKRVDEEIAKIKFPLKSTILTSAVPLGLAYYSYYNNYSLTKGIGVVVIGSVVAWFGVLTFSGGKFV